MEIAKKMAQENFSIGVFYNITKNQDNPIKTVGRDSFLSPKSPKICKTGNDVIYDVIIWVQDGNCKKNGSREF